MTPLERLLQEAIPMRPAPAVHSVWTEQEQDEHWDDLCRAVRAPNYRKHPRPRRPEERAADEVAA